jgi:hypothetical protein
MRKGQVDETSSGVVDEIASTIKRSENHEVTPLLGETSWNPHSDKDTVRLVDDWRALLGMPVQIRRQEVPIRRGIVEDITWDGAAIWLAQEGNLGRMLVHKDEDYQVWVSCRR